MIGWKEAEHGRMAGGRLTVVDWVRKRGRSSLGVRARAEAKMPVRPSACILRETGFLNVAEVRGLRGLSRMVEVRGNVQVESADPLRPSQR